MIRAIRVPGVPDGRLPGARRSCAGTGRPDPAPARHEAALVEPAPAGDGTPPRWDGRRPLGREAP
ncbi:hypothetical protein GCM10019016_036290 [Streptomyces prasinosporus]|uniref:Uncharacterized protein n=1 Tax=Streptomyces prasinosporus TaxID=68256 RepID=A0ABP6TPU1_9ACTN